MYIKTKPHVLLGRSCFDLCKHASDTFVCVIKSSVWQGAILSFQKAEPNMTEHHDCTFEKQVSHLWLVTRSAMTNLYI